MKNEQRIFLNKHSYLSILIVVLFIVSAALAMLSPFFFSIKNLRNILNMSAIYLIISIGMTLVISAGQIDLSVGSIIGFSGMSYGMLMQAGLPTGLAILLGLSIAGLIGMINGVIIAYGKINSFIVTLSTMTIIRAIILIVSGSKSVFGFNEWFRYIGSGKIGVFNIPIYLSLLIALIGAIILHKTLFGSHCLFLGANETALKRAGVNTNFLVVKLFILSGLCAGLAGLIVTARLNSAEPLAGQGYEMDAIAATILGGTWLKGGRGSMFGTLVACLILNVLKNGLTLLSISTNYQGILTGIILLASVLISQYQRKEK